MTASDLAVAGWRFVPIPDFYPGLREPRMELFAGGDMVRGSDVVVTAVFEGREAAAGITACLNTQGEPPAARW